MILFKNPVVLQSIDVAGACIDCSSSFASCSLQTNLLLSSMWRWLVVLWDLLVDLLYSLYFISIHSLCQLVPVNLQVSNSGTRSLLAKHRFIGQYKTRFFAKSQTSATCSMTSSPAWARWHAHVAEPEQEASPQQRTVVRKIHDTWVRGRSSIKEVGESHLSVEKGNGYMAGERLEPT